MTRRRRWINEKENYLSVFTEESCENVGRWSTQRLSPPKKEAAGGPYRSTRFGFRVNRPASTGNKNSSYDNVLNNNHSDSRMNGKF